MQERILGFVAIALALVIAGLALFWQPDVAERLLPRLPIVEGGDLHAAIGKRPGLPEGLSRQAGARLFRLHLLPGYLPDLAGGDGEGFETVVAGGAGAGWR